MYSKYLLIPVVLLYRQILTPSLSQINNYTRVSVRGIYCVRCVGTHLKRFFINFFIFTSQSLKFYGYLGPPIIIISDPILFIARIFRLLYHHRIFRERIKYSVCVLCILCLASATKQICHHWAFTHNYINIKLYERHDIIRMKVS